MSHFTNDGWVPLINKPTRAVGAGVFNHKFGKGATARLLKYRARMAKGQRAVNHLICSELIVLAYQFASSEKGK